MKGVYLKKGNTRVTVVPYYRVGDLFLTTIATNPSSFLGGTWELFGPGRCLVCVNTSDSDFNTVKKTGGNKYHYHDLTDNGWAKITMHGTGKLCYHELSIGSKNAYNSNFYIQGTGGGSESETDQWGAGLGGRTDYSNGNTLQPYITCYIWIRTA